MAYTRTWDETAPNGATTDAATIDTLFQNFKVDLRERFATIGINLTVDPVTLTLPPSTNPIPGTNCWTPYLTGGRTDGAASTLHATLNANYIEVVWDGVGITTVTWAVPLLVPAGATFDNLKANVYRDAAASLSMTLYKTFNGAATSLGTVASASTGWHTITLAGPFTLAASNAHFAEFSLQTNGTGTAIARLSSLFAEDV